jgi:hypothetical protein
MTPTFWLRSNSVPPIESPGSRLGHTRKALGVPGTPGNAETNPCPPLGIARKPALGALGQPGYPKSPWTT